jgi:phage tail tube protein FII
MDSSITLNLTYFCAELNGKKVLEVNKVSPTFRVNGKDMLAPIKKLT